MSAEWHFFATSHGKGPCDGVGGTVKRLAARASLQRPYKDQIWTPHQLFEFGCTAIPTVNFHVTTYICWRPRTRINLSWKKIYINKNNCRYSSHRLHTFCPISAVKLEVRDFSANKQKRIECVFMSSSTMSNNVVNITANIRYITAVYDHAWWLMYVSKTMPNSSKVEVSFLEPKGPGLSLTTIPCWYPCDKQWGCSESR